MSRIVIFDGQVFQTNAWNRGMGKYSLCLVEAMLKELSDDEVSIYLVLTKHLPLSLEAKRILKQIDPRIKYAYLDLTVPTSYAVEQSIINRAANTVTLDHFIDRVSAADDSVKYVILALFIDEVCGAFPSKSENILLFYDLIPFFYYEYYGGFATYQTYLSQFKSLMQADKIMTISQTVADEVSGFLGIPKNKLCNIDGGPIKRNHIEPVKPEAFDVPSEYILMSTGNDMRKNNLRAVQGFEEYRLSSNDSEIYLIITSTFDEATRDRLLENSNHIIFTGNIPEEQLLWLYKHMRSLLFIPESEGLGLPILEAVEVDKPIVCSKIGPFFEMSQSAFYYTNHFDISDIADTIAEALSGYQWSDRLSQYSSIISKYQWERAAKKAVDFLNQPLNPKPDKKRKIAIIGPDPSGYSAIGKVMEQAHPALSEYYDIDYYIEKQKNGNTVLRPSYIEYIASARAVEQFDVNMYAQYDEVIYHIGNSEFHSETIKRANYLPGFVIIHDTHLANIYSEMYAHNQISETRCKAEEKLDEILESPHTSRLGSLLNNQFGVFVHSDYAKHAIEDLKLPALKITKTVLATEVAEQPSPRLSPKITIGLAGIIHPIKGMKFISQLARHMEFENVQFEVFGMSMATPEDLRELSILPNVNVTTNLSDYQFQLKLSQLDIIVNYREHYHGETSLAVIEAMRAGVIPIVRDEGWFSELPNNAVVKLKTSKSINKAISALMANPDDMRQRSKMAKQYIKDNFTYEKYGENIVSMLESSRQGQKEKIVRNLKDGDIDGALRIVWTGEV